MHIKMSLWFAAILGTISLGGTAFAHPGHAPTDLAAEVSQPLAGPDHLVAFLALTALLLAGLHIAVKLRAGRNSKLQKSNIK
jgi:hydrogenase/urease accessory protein HupE